MLTTVFVYCSVGVE